VVAQDRMERWWDCTLNHFLAGRLIDGPLRPWLEARLRERGLTELLDVQLSMRLLDWRLDPAETLRNIERDQRRRRGPFARMRERLRRLQRT